METISPFSIKNIRCFIAFRLFFNARFYYPVFTILFLDYGLTIEQFALLNSVWAATIVLTEVPSGALADLLGRKQLIFITSVLMITEMLLLSFVPLGNISVVFWVFLVNRVLSGLAEALASGADEALAYDSLVENEMEDEWPAVLSLSMRVQAVASIIIMTCGAFVYDANAVNSVLHFLGSSLEFSQQTTMRFPIYLTLILGILAFFTVTQMRETEGERGGEHMTYLEKISRASKLTLEAGKWILATPFALVIILFGMFFDHIMRMLITMTSQLLRLIMLPDASFGLVGSAMAAVGIFLPKLAEKMVDRFSPLQNLSFLIIYTCATLAGLALFIPYFGVVFVAMISAGIMFTKFFTSHYLNKIAESHQRATVLSFNGLAFNLAYGLIGIFFAYLIDFLKQQNSEIYKDASMTFIENESFINAIYWFLPYTLILFTLLFIFSRYHLGTSYNKFRTFR